MPLRARQIVRRAPPTMGWLSELLSEMPLLKKLFWLYFLLLIFEGALRKWVFPNYAAPLLVVRDPVGFWIIWEAFRTHKWPRRWAGIIATLVVFMCGLGLLQVIMNNVPWYVVAYGLRSYLLPFPVAFIMGENLDAEDLRKFAVCTLFLMVPMTVLEVAQFRAPATSLLNVGAGKGATQIMYAGAHVRASGTFSFVIGPALYGPLVAAFIFYGLTSDRFVKRWLLWAATGALILSVPVAGSRTLVYGLYEVVACAAFASIWGARQFVRSLRIVIPVVAMYFLVSMLPDFAQASQTLHARFAGAEQVEGGSIEASLEGRTLGPVIESIEAPDYSQNFLGSGLGLGAVAISKLMTGRFGSLIGEYEITRLMFEFGPIWGLVFATSAFVLALSLGFAAVLRARQGAPLALLLFPLLFSSLVMAVLEQPTEQGFMVISLAFTLAALERGKAPAREARQLRPVARPMPYSAAGVS